MTNETPTAEHSPFKIEVNLAKGEARRVRNTSREDGIPLLPLETKLREGFSAVAGAIQLTGDDFSHRAIATHVDNLAYGWALLARENEHVRRFVSYLVETNAWLEAAVPTAMVLIMIAWHHNLMPDRIEHIGQKVTIASGVIPVSREQEREAHNRVKSMGDDELREAFEKAQREAMEGAARAAEREEGGSNGQVPPDDSESPSISPIIDFGDAGPSGSTIN